MSQPSSLVQLRPHGFDPQTGYTIGPAPDGTDKTPFPQTQEYRKCAICQDMALAGETGDGANFAVLAALGGTSLLRTHEVERVAPVLEAMQWDLPR